MSIVRWCRAKRSEWASRGVTSRTHRRGQCFLASPFFPPPPLPPIRRAPVVARSPSPPNLRLRAVALLRGGTRAWCPPPRALLAACFHRAGRRRGPVYRLAGVDSLDSGSSHFDGVHLLASSLAVGAQRCRSRIAVHLPSRRCAGSGRCARRCNHLNRQIYISDRLEVSGGTCGIGGGAGVVDALRDLMVLRHHPPRVLPARHFLRQRHDRRGAPRAHAPRGRPGKSRFRRRLRLG